MANEQKELQQLFSVQEKNEQLLSNLDKLKSTGSVTEDQYNSLKRGYVNTINEAGAIILTRKSNILQAIGTEEQKAVMLENEINTLSIRQQTGELTSSEAQKKQAKLQKQVQQKRDFIAEMKRLYASSNSSDVGGYVDTKVTTAALAKTASRGVSSSSGNGIGAAIQGTSASDFTEIRTDVGEMTSSPLQLLGPIGGVLLLISLFQPAYTVSAFGVSVQSMTLMSLPDTSVGTFLFIAALVTIGSIVFVRENARSIAQLGMSIIASLLLFMEISSRMNSVNTTIVKAFGAGATPSIGIYLAILAIIIILVGGIKELKS
jgi:hypothetical protein